MPSSRKVSGGGGGRYRCPKVNLKKKKKNLLRHVVLAKRDP
jgi:hypothetical protein